MRLFYRYFTVQGDRSNKFWSIEISREDNIAPRVDWAERNVVPTRYFCTTTYGKIGSNGRTLVKVYPTLVGALMACAQACKLKIRNWYEEDVPRRYVMSDQKELELTGETYNALLPYINNFLSFNPLAAPAQMPVALKPEQNKLVAKPRRHLVV